MAEGVVAGATVVFHANEKPGACMHRDHHGYIHFTGKYRVERAVNSLLGLVEGIVIDSEINAEEIRFLETWLSDQEDVEDRHPFCELVPVVRAAIADGVLSREEHEDIKWLCAKFKSSEHFVGFTADIQRLHALLAGIAADRTITTEELRGLSSWLEEHSHLSKTWPFEEACSLVTGVLADSRISGEEQRTALDFCGEFVAILDSRTLVQPPILQRGNVVGLCAVCPQIEFSGKAFCFTGASTRHTRAYLETLVQELGGTARSGVARDLDYLVVGADGNPCWAYACYGRKIERAVQLRREGFPLMIIHEHDFHDAVADVR